MRITKVVTIIAAIGLMSATTLSFAAGLKDAKPVFQSGNWTVLRSTDSMTDAPRCTGIYKNNRRIQLKQKKLFVGIHGGIEGITLRFGDNPPKSTRLPEEIEKKMNVVIISGSDFSELTGSNRLRLEVLTLLQGIADEDLDLTGIQAAVENIGSGCPDQPQPASVSVPKQAVSENLCSDELVKKMKANGLKAAQIKKICEK